MLKLQSHGGAVINTDDFYIYHKSDGLDELIFNLSIYDENYPNINEEDIIEYEQPYLVKAIDGGGSKAKIKCQIDLDDLKATLNTAYTNNSDTVVGTITGVLPEGWVVIDKSGLSIRRTIEGAYTPYDVIMQCPATYGVVLQFKPKQKQVIVDMLSNYQPMGSFVSRDLNLKEINYKGKSTDFYTRLYAYGKNGLSFADINDGKPYVENFQYTDKIICAYWQDDRYEVPQNLLDAANERVAIASIPERSYSCTVMDLAKTNPEMYGFEDFQMFTVVRLIDDIKNVSVNYQVAELWDYPYYPEKNVVTLSSATPKIQNTVQAIKGMVEKPQTSPIWSYMNTAIQNATNMITGVNGGYVVIQSNAQGQPTEILIMDTPDISTAQNVWRWNQNGFGHSSNGYNGPYDTAITIDGQIVADFIVAGTMLADRIKGGTLIIGGNQNENGVISIRNSAGTEVGRWDSNGIVLTTGTISDLTGQNYWNLSTGEFQLAGTATVDGQTFSEIQQSITNAQQSAEDAQESVGNLDNSLNQEGVFNRLTNNGQIQGLYMQNNQLYVNASYIASGILKIGGLNNQNGQIEIYDSSGNVIGTWDNSGFNTKGKYFAVTGEGAVYSNSPVLSGIVYMAGSLTGNITSYADEIKANVMSLRFQTSSSQPTGTYLMNLAYNPLTGGGWTLKDVRFTSTDIDSLSVGADSVSFSGNISVSGEKNRIVDTENYGVIKFPAYETTSPIFGDVGTGYTDESGECVIAINDAFLEAANTEMEYQVFLQKEGQGDLWIEEKAPSYFIVKGTPGIKFSWELKAKQRNYEYHRIERFLEPDRPISADRFLETYSIEEMEEQLL